MEGKGLVRCAVLILALVISGCRGTLENNGYAQVSINFSNSGFLTKALNPDEESVRNISILVYDSNGFLEESLWLEGNEIYNGIKLNLLSGKEYRFLACANYGYRVSEPSMEDVLNHRFHLAYPDEYTEGIPMTADSGPVSIEDDAHICLKLVRLMSKISLRVDRSDLDKDVELIVRSVEIGNCPKSAVSFGRSKTERQDECFAVGFLRDAEECSPLNEIAQTGISKEISVYMLENMQGRFSETDIKDDSEKIIDEYDPRTRVCSYIEVCMDYLSKDWKSSGKGLIYRFYLGEDRNSLDVERNCHYRITIRPENDGLGEDSWRVDKSNIEPAGPISFSYWPDGYIRGNIGDTVHLGCSFTPSYAPFDVGLEYMMDDKEAGIYDYVIDEDGHGATLTFTGPGRGLIYMEAGEPVNEAALWIIEVNQPNP